LRTAPMSVDDIGAGPKLGLEPPEVEPLDTGTAGMSAEYSLKSRAATPWRKTAETDSGTM
jgi:hypothetical protein